MKIKSIALWLSVAAAFSLAYWPSAPGKIGDFLFVVIGLALVFDGQTRSEIRALWPKLKPYAWCFSAILALTAVAQIASRAAGHNDISGETAVNWTRMAFNAYVFLLSAFLACNYGKKYLLPASLAIFLSPLLILPAYWNLREGGYIDSARLTGFLQNPIIFGLWMTMAFILGLAVFMSRKRIWQKTAAAFWLIFVAAFIIWAASRAAWLSVALAAILFSVFYVFEEKKPAKAGLAAAIFLLTFFLGYQTVPSYELARPFVADRAKNLASGIVRLAPSEIKSQNQTNVWPIALKFIVRNPLGVGFGGYTTKYLAKNSAAADNDGYLREVASNSFLEIALYGGLGALLAFLVILAKIGKEARKTIGGWFSGESELRDLRLAWFIAAAALVFDIFFTNGFLWRHTWFVLGTALGVSLGASRENRAPGRNSV